MLKIFSEEQPKKTEEFTFTKNFVSEIKDFDKTADIRINGNPTSRNAQIILKLKLS